MFDECSWCKAGPAFVGPLLGAGISIGVVWFSVSCQQPYLRDLDRFEKWNGWLTVLPGLLAGVRSTLRDIEVSRVLAASKKIGDPTHIFDRFDSTLFREGSKDLMALSNSATKLVVALDGLVLDMNLANSRLDIYFEQVSDSQKGPMGQSNMWITAVALKYYVERVEQALTKASAEVKSETSKLCRPRLWHYFPFSDAYRP